MTLIEVLIAGIILFISISAISLVARTKILNQQKLMRATETAYLAEYSRDIIKYHLKHSDVREGQITLGQQEYQWLAIADRSAPPRRVLEESEGSAHANRDLLLLYTVTITPTGTKNGAFTYKELVWEMQL
ncbi:hypothetical protein [Thalassotalea ganghwensis]